MAHVQGDIEEVEGVLRITEIRILYRLKITADSRDTVHRAFSSHSENCPAYQSVKGCIDCSWSLDAEVEEG